MRQTHNTVATAAAAASNSNSKKPTHTTRERESGGKTRIYIFLERGSRDKSSATTRHALTLISRTSFHFSSRLGELDKTRSNTLRKHYSWMQKLEVRIWSPNKHFHWTKNVSDMLGMHVCVFCMRVRVYDGRNAARQPTVLMRWRCSCSCLRICVFRCLCAKIFCSNENGKYATYYTFKWSHCYICALVCRESISASSSPSKASKKKEMREASMANGGGGRMCERAQHWLQNRFVIL